MTLMAFPVPQRSIPDHAPTSCPWCGLSSCPWCGLFATAGSDRNGTAPGFGAKVLTAGEHRLFAIGARVADRGGEGKARMRRRLAVVAARAVRAVRGLWPDRNPLRRTLDRVEAVVVGGLAVAFLAGAPLAAVTAGHLAYSAASRTAYTQRAA
jgi:hypothetical protein